MKSFKKLLISVSTSIFLLHVASAFAQENVAIAETLAQPQHITIAVNVGHPPFSVLLPNGELTGLLPDMWRLWGEMTFDKIALDPPP